MLLKNLQDDFNHIKIQSWKHQNLISSDFSQREICKFLENHHVVKAKPFIKWVGGKRQLLKQFKNIYPKNFDPIKNTYFEPFVGGGAIFFDLQPFNSVISDINKELITTYLVLRDDVENLINKLEEHVYEKEHFLKIRDLNIEEMSDVEIAARFIYLNKTCFNGMYRVNKKGKFNVPFGRYVDPLICDERNLRNVSYILKNVDIKLQDYETILKNAKKGDFVYFDPPYYPLNKTSNFTSYNSTLFLEREQERLRDVFFDLNKRGCFLMLSNSNTDFIKKIYSTNLKNIKIIDVLATRNINSKASKRGKISELVIINY